MRRLGYLALFLVIGALFPLLVWVGFGAYIYQSHKLARARRPAVPMTCTIDADCPPGYICVDGRCARVST